MFDPAEVFVLKVWVVISAEIEATRRRLTNEQATDGRVWLRFVEQCDTGHIRQLASNLSDIAKRKDLQHLWLGTQLYNDIL